MLGLRCLRRMLSPKKITQLKLLTVIVSIPLGSLYIGYVIGEHLLGPPRRFPDKDVVVDSYQLNYTWQHSHNITVDFAGGLGNMMFQYASLYGMAKGNALKPVIQPGLLTQLFEHLEAKYVDKKANTQRWPKFREMRPMGFDRRAFSLNFQKNIHMEGFYQSWKYFEHVKRDIKRQLKFTERSENIAEKFLQDTRAAARWPFENQKESPKEVTFIGMHIRRGDFLLQQSIEDGYMVADMDYMERAMDYFRNKYPNVIFVVCSDDKEWTKKNIKSPSTPVVVSPYGTASFDLNILSKCNHTIMTVGTFSWWAAYLADGEAVYYKHFPRPGSKLAYSFLKDDYYYPHWIGMV